MSHRSIDKFLLTALYDRMLIEILDSFWIRWLFLHLALPVHRDNELAPTHPGAGEGLLKRIAYVRHRHRIYGLPVYLTPYEHGFLLAIRFDSSYLLNRKARAQGGGLASFAALGANGNGLLPSMVTDPPFLCPWTPSCGSWSRFTSL